MEGAEGPAKPVRAVGHASWGWYVAVKQRLDQLLVGRGLFESRAKARAAIEAGRVVVAGRLARRPGEPVDPSVEITASPAWPWVGRGALKLEHAFDVWPLDVAGAVALDIGASTGGFTEVCLSRGARRVYAVDVGEGQLHPRIAADPRVTDMSGVDARALDRTTISEPPDLVVCDASFISLTKVLPAALGLAGPGARLVALVKPQFEAGPEHVGKGGLVRDEAVHARVLEDVKAWLTSQGWDVEAMVESPVSGGHGQKEHLLLARKSQK